MTVQLMLVIGRGIGHEVFKTGMFCGGVIVSTSGSAGGGVLYWEGTATVGVKRGI